MDDEADIKKRNRVSFVCQQCRRAKTKCDKLKPQCGRCVKNNCNCIYDVDLQRKPKNPSKNAIIKRLQAELNNYKSKYLQILQNSENPSPSCRNDSINSINDTVGSNITINLYQEHPTLIVNRVLKRETKPLSENYILLQDKFLSTLVCSVFLDPNTRSNKNAAMIPALTANAAITRAKPSVTRNVLKLKENLIRKSKDSQQKLRINQFTERLLQQHATKNAHKNKNWGNDQSINFSNKTKSGILLNSIVVSTINHEYLEDHCTIKNSKGEYEYSDLLNTIISELESILPPYEIISRYKAHFYDTIFPNLPFLDKESFEKSLSLTLVPLPVDERKGSKNITIKLGEARIRNKIENICILLVILKLSYISFLFIKDGSLQDSLHVNKEILEKYPIENDSVNLAQQCLSAGNLCAYTNENTITCLLYIWAFFVFSPEEGDFFLEHPTDILNGMITMLATSIGLHRDPADFPSLSDQSISSPSLLNHRRLLWVAVVTTSCFESCLKGRHSASSKSLLGMFLGNMHDPESLENYMKKVKRDMGDSVNPTLLKVHESSFLRMQLALYLADLDNLTLCYDRPVSLVEIENMVNNIESFVDLNFPILDLKSDAGLTNGKNDKRALDSTGKWMVRLAQVSSSDYSSALHSRLLSNLIILRTTTAIFLHFETLLQDGNETFMPFYIKYFTKSCLDALSLVNYFKKFFGGAYGTKYSSLSDYNVTKVAQLALSSTLFTLLGVLLRLELAELTFEERIPQFTIHPQEQTEWTLKRNICRPLKKFLEGALEEIYVLASEHLRFTYFSVFKMLALCDVVIQRIKNGDLWSNLASMFTMENMDPKLMRALKMMLGVELDKRNTFDDFFAQKNHLLKLSLAQLKEIYNKVDSNYNIGGEKDATDITSRASTVHANDKRDALVHDTGANMPAPPPSSAPDNFTAMGNQDMNARHNWNNYTTSNIRQSPVNNNENLQGFTDTYMGMDENIFKNPDNIGNMDFHGVFGGLDLFDYDFLFGNE